MVDDGRFVLVVLPLPPRVTLCAIRNGNDIGLCEIVAVELQREVLALRERVGEHVPEIQSGAMVAFPKWQ